MRHDAFSKTSLIRAYARYGYDMEAIGVFRETIMENMAFDQSAITSLLQVCSSFGHLRMARELHHYALKTFFKFDALLLNDTITLYSRCGDVASAETVFNLMEKKDIMSSMALLTCYAQNGLVQDVLMFYRKCSREG
jgi:pentatricopeptide repeat protein